VIPANARELPFTANDYGRQRNKVQKIIREMSTLRRCAVESARFQRVMQKEKIAADLPARIALPGV